MRVIMCCCWFYVVTLVFPPFEINALKTKHHVFIMRKDEFCNGVGESERPQYLIGGQQSHYSNFVAY